MSILIAGIDISSDGSHVAVGSDDNNVYFFDSQGILLWQYQTGGVVKTVSMSGEGQLIAVGSDDKNVYLFDQDGNLLWKYQTGDIITDISISDDGQYIAACSQDQYTYFFNCKGSLLWKYHSGYGWSVSISADGECIAIGSLANKIYCLNRDGTLIWNFSTADMSIFYGSRNDVNSVSISDDGQYIAAGSRTKKVYFHKKDGTYLWNYDTRGIVNRVAVSADGNRISAMVQDFGIFFIDRNGDLIWTYNLENNAHSLGISGDGQLVVTGADKLYCLNHDGNLLWTYPMNAEVQCVVISADGQYMAAGSSKNIVYFFKSDGTCLWNSDESRTKSQVEDNSIKVQDLNPQIILHINRLLENQPNPLDMLDDFYAYLKIKKFDLSVETEAEIKKYIESVLEARRKKIEEEQQVAELESKLFGRKNTPPASDSPKTNVEPRTIIPPGSACQICLSEFSSAEPGAVACLHCNNIFHYRCITKWVNKNHSCPICKKELSV